MPLEEHPPGLGVRVHSSSLIGVLLRKDEVRHGGGGQATHTLILAWPLTGTVTSLLGAFIS